ncbi:Y-family DNA polymerase [Lentisalinibacter sediminis]|uniref:Y-family DNA polymerase n=1 Tax=Lentisalinibacter sediminis TaxID=2992237 RepID=UPI003864D436
MVSPSEPDSVLPAERESPHPRSERGRVTAVPEPDRQQPLPLGGGEPPAEDPSPAYSRQRRSQLWLCVRLPGIALEALDESTAAPTGPVAVVEEEGGQVAVHLANRAAAAAGIRPGQTLSAALALAPGLLTLSRRPRRERILLEALADWAGRFSSLVSLEAPDALLLEVQGSLRLFRGLDRLCRLVTEGLRQRGHRALVCVGPTPLAALWLSREGGGRVDEVTALPRHLNPLDLRVTGWPAAVLQGLTGIGVTTIGECRRLPREGFARRFGAARLQTLDRAFGRLPDPRLHYTGPPRFREQIDLGEETRDEALLAAGCSRLLASLEEFLLRHQRTARRLRFRFFHLRGGVTPLTLGFSDAGCDVEHWRSLLGIRLERLRLPAPAIAVELATGRLEQREGDTVALPLVPGQVGRHDGGLPRLVESLRARLGENAVRGLRSLAEHRPQQAWDETDPLEGMAGGGGAGPSPWNRVRELPAAAGRGEGDDLLLERPLWILTQPQRLAMHEGHPCHDGPLQFVDGPERIESGWWDGADTARDYYVAETRTGARLWVYRDRRPPAGWYLQGIFG